MNTLTLDPDVTITGRVYAPSGADNTYNQNGATESNFTQINFP